jgi:hypothetical protein
MTRSFGSVGAAVQVKSKLRLFQGALLQLLQRDPRERPSMQQFCNTCAFILGDSEHVSTFDSNAPQGSPSNREHKDSGSSGPRGP